MNIDNFCNLGAALQNKQVEVGKQPQIFFYRSNEDSIYEMLSDGYFNALNLRVAKDDLILLYSPNNEQKVFARVVSNNGGIVKIREMTEDDFQHVEMPVPSIEYLNKIIQYIGETTTEAPIYVNGFFYKCVENSGVYSWENIIVQDSYLKSETYNQTEIDNKLSEKANVHDATLTGTTTINSADIASTDTDTLTVNTSATINDATLTGSTSTGSISATGDLSVSGSTSTGSLTVSTSATVPEPTSDSNPATKQYVDNAIATSKAGYHPYLLYHEWDDKIRTDMSWLRADTFSWQNGTTYQEAMKHLLKDILMDRFYLIATRTSTVKWYRSPEEDTETRYAWGQNSYTTLYTDKEFPENGDNVYYDNGTIADTVTSLGTSSSSYITTTDDGDKKFYRASDLDETGYYAWTYDTLETYFTTSDSPIATDDAYKKVGGVFTVSSSIDTVELPPTAQTETIEGITITYYVGADTHKIVLSDQESTVLDIYNACGTAWYYILDTVNQRFKLPRKNPTRENLITLMRAKGNGNALGLTNGTVDGGWITHASNNNIQYSMGITGGTYGNPIVAAGTVVNNNFNSMRTDTQAIGVSKDPIKSGIVIDPNDSDTVFAGSKYLYFYVGNFTQTAIENTAGLNAELFNDKADRNLNNVDNNIDFIIDSQEPTAENNYTGYELYRSGKVYQYGYWNYYNSISAGSTVNTTINLPIKMQFDSNKPVNYYSFVACQYSNTNKDMGEEIRIHSLGATSFEIHVLNRNGGTASGVGVGFSWFVYGKADLT